MNSCDFDEIELMQSTGVFDKNGREIFEGDIIKFGDAVAVVRFDDTFGLYVEFGKEEGEFDFPEVSSLEEMEEGKEQLSTCFIVVGNIYENPELVEG